MNKPAPIPALIEQHTIPDKKTKPVAFSDLILSGMQLRVSISQEAVARYAEAYQAKADIPAIVVFKDADSGQYWLADGHHRVAAAKKAGLTKLDAIVKQGTILDALLYGARSNHAHGEPLTNDDKRHTVARFLDIPEWRKKSDRWIGTAAQVSPHLVAKVRKSLPKEQQSTVRESKDGTTRDTKNIGKKAKPKPEPKPEDPDDLRPTLDVDDLRVQQLIFALSGRIANISGFDVFNLAERDVLASLFLFPATEECPQPERGILRMLTTDWIHHPSGVAISKVLRDLQRRGGGVIRPDRDGEITRWYLLTEIYDAIAAVHKAKHNEEPEELNADSADLAGEPAVGRSTSTAGDNADAVPPPIMDDTLAARRVVRVRELLAEQLLKGKPQCCASDRSLVSLALVVGVPVGADDEAWSDDLPARCWGLFADRLRLEVADYLTRGETRRLPPLAQLAIWWGINIKAIAIQAERAVKG